MKPIGISPAEVSMHTHRRAEPQFRGLMRRAVGFGRVLCLLLLPLSACVSTVSEPLESADHSLRFTAKSGIVTVNGRFSRWRVAASNIDRGDVTASFVEIEIEVASIESGIGRRDDHLRDPDFFEVERWPLARVRVHDIRPTADPAEFVATFDIRIKDRDGSLEGPFRVVSWQPLVVAGEVTIDRVAFGVGDPPRRMNPLDPDAEVGISFRLTLP